MSAEKLREAARLMRERAVAATPGPWRVHPTQYPGVISPTGWIFDYDATSTQDATHIASWHPAVALAVADWLEGQATSAANLEQVLGASESQIANLLCDALAVATAYLNEVPS